MDDIIKELKDLNWYEKAFVSIAIFGAVKLLEYLYEDEDKSLCEDKD